MKQGGGVRDAQTKAARGDHRSRTNKNKGLQKGTCPTWVKGGEKIPHQLHERGKGQEICERKEKKIRAKIPPHVPGKKAINGDGESSTKE